jgi:hypothetical protein
MMINLRVVITPTRETQRVADFPSKVIFSASLERMLILSRCLTSPVIAICVGRTRTFSLYLALLKAESGRLARLSEQGWAGSSDLPEEDALADIDWKHDSQNWDSGLLELGYLRACD